MKLTVDGIGSVSLCKSDFVGAGGQASVYAKGDTAYKVYTDPADSIPAARIKALSTLTDPRILRPERLLLRRSTPVGYTMRYLPDSTPLCATFPRAYRDRHGLTRDDVVARMADLAQLIGQVHAAGVQIVDLNPMNVLLDDAGSPYLIDVDSWQLSGFPATALQDAVRDRHAPPGVFSAGTDWFAFAVVCFQALIGIHPFKGRHPDVKGLDARMRAGISALSSDVRLPGVCYPTDHIPAPWRAWMTDVFHHHVRTPPPVNTACSTPTSQAPVVAPTALLLTERLRLPTPIAAAALVGGRRVVLSGGTIFVDGRVFGSAPAGAVIADAAGHPVVAWIAGGRLGLLDVDAGRPIPTDLAADQLAALAGRLVVKSHDAVLQVSLLQLGEHILATTSPLASVLPQATRLLPGLIAQDLLGAAWITVLPAAGGSHPLRVPALDGATILAGRLAHRTAELLVSVGGRFDRLRLNFAVDFSSVDVNRVKDVPPQEPELVSLGELVIGLEDDGALRLERGTAQRRVIDAAIGTDCRLFTDGGLMVARDGTLYSAQMRP
jgi:serine/threonine protein kinase